MSMMFRILKASALTNYPGLACILSELLSRVQIPQKIESRRTRPRHEKTTIDLLQI